MKFTPITILTFFPLLIPPSEEWFESKLSLLLTSPTAASSAAGADVGVRDEPGARGGNGGDGLGDLFIGECAGAELEVGTGVGRDNDESDRVEEPETEMSLATKIEKQRIQPRKPPRVKRSRIVRVSPLARYKN